MRSRYIGIDPGVSGGLACITTYADPVGPPVVTAIRMPETDDGVLAALRDMYDPHYTSDPVYAALERVHASPQMGVVSAFTFGRGYGRLCMALAALTIPYEAVLPRRWQQGIGCISGGDKNVTKRKAQALFPQVPKITHATADALLLAEYCRRSHQVRPA